MEFIQQHKKSIMVLVGSGFLFGAGYVSGGLMFASTIYKDIVRNEVHKEMNQSRDTQATKSDSIEHRGRTYRVDHIHLPVYGGGCGEKFPNLFVEIMMGIKEKVDDISNRLIKETKK